MDKENLLISGILIITILILLGIGILLSPNSVNTTSLPDNLTNLHGFNSTNKNLTDPIFDISTPESTAISIARLNEGLDGFNFYIKANASLTSDGKYCIVDICNENYEYEGLVVTVDAQTWMSKKMEV